MRFEAKGTIHGEAVAVAWTDGSLTGNGMLIRSILIEAAALEGELVGPVGQQTETQHLKSALSALVIISQVLPGAVFTGEVPEAESVPPDAIA